MALNDNTRVIPGTGYIHSAPVGVAKPTNMTQPAAPWEDTGHAAEDGLTISRGRGYAATNVGQIREEGGPLTGSRYHHLPECARLNVGHSAEAAGSSVHSAMSGSPTSPSGHCILADRVYFIVDNTKGPGGRAPSLTDVQKVADVVLASLLITAPPMHRMAARWRASVWRHGRRGRAAAAQGADRKHRVRPPGASGRRGPRYCPTTPRRTWHGSPPARSPGLPGAP